MNALLYAQQATHLGLGFYGPLIGMVVLTLLAVPVWVVIGLGASAMLYFTGALPLSLFGNALFDGINSFALIAIPLFILTGDLLVRTGLSNKLLDLAEATVGSARTGLGCATVLGAGFFACISGSDSADTAAIGRVTLDRLIDRGYPEPLACALVAAGSCTGILIPPSISYIILGLILGQSVATLFLAALVPGVIVLIAILLTTVVVNRIYGYENARDKFSFRRWIAALWAARYAVMIPFIILGGIYSGVFTPTEAAAIAVAVIATIGFVQGTLSLKDLPKILESSAKVNGVILPIIAMSLPLAQTFSTLNIPQSFVATMAGLSSNPVVLVLIMIAILMIAGAVMETTPNIVILSPLMLPLAQHIGMNDIHFSILMISALGVGFITPPFGLNLFVVSSLRRTSVLSVAWRAVPYVLGMLLAVLLIAFVPQLSLWAF